MIFSILKWVIISFTLIFLMHHLYQFLMNTLTVPKIKDLVNKPNEQYQDIFRILEKNQPTAGASAAAGAAGASATAGASAAAGAAGASAAAGAAGAAGASATAGASAADANSSDIMRDELSSFLNDLKKAVPNKKQGDFLAANEMGGSDYSAY